jgi:galactokinase/mevalonate kinase-like predicted kinase
VHIIPLLISKAFTAEALIDYANSITNLIIGLERKLNDSYLAVMTGIKVLEFANSPSIIKNYIRDMVKENNKKIDKLNAELATINSSPILKVKNIARIRAINQMLSDLHLQNEELTHGIDPKDLMLEGTKR